jgi:DNA polymerase
MPILFRDIETRSAARLKEAGAWRYAADLTTQVWCVGYAVDDGSAEIWIPGQPIPEPFVEAAQDPSWLITAHNDMFERAIEEHLLHPQHNWPLVPLERHRCTMAMALANALPGDLGNVAEALQLPYLKDAEGRRLMLKMSRPRHPREDEDPNILHWVDDPGSFARLCGYCRQDVETERALYHRVPLLLPVEQETWQLDAIINQRGFYADRELAEAIQKIVLEEQVSINREIGVLTDGRITSINQVSKIQAFLHGRGHKTKSLNKRSVSAVLAHGPAADIQRLLELRREGAQAAAHKIKSLLAGIDSDHRVRGTLLYHRASTGRWSGSRFQPQNLKKPKTKDLTAAVDAILSGDRERIRAFGAPLAVAGDVSRSLVRAAPGYMLIGADFSAIESRVLAWIANETWKLEAYRKFDISQDSQDEPYCQIAVRVLKRPIESIDEAAREIGKTCDLAFGFGGGVGAWRKFDPDQLIEPNDAKVNDHKIRFRDLHKATVRFWHALENGLRRALRTGRRITINNLAFECNELALYVTLPNGRRLAYPKAHMVPGKFAGTTQIAFKDNARGKWADVYGWHGTFTENVVQAISRDLLAVAMHRLERSSYPIILHIHDEIVCEVPEGFGNCEEFLRLMTELPAWAAGLPIAAKAWTGPSYGKPKIPKPAILDPSPDSARDATQEPTPKRVATQAPQKTLQPVPVNFNGFQSQAELHPTTTDTGVKLPDPEPELPQILLADVIGQPLIAGKVCCPFHADDTPSCHIYDDHFHCFGCGAHGGAIDWLRDVEEMDHDAAIQLLANLQGALTRPRKTDGETRTLANAKRLWEQAQPISGTLGIQYLADIRGIDTDMLPPGAEAVLRFHPRCPFGPGNQVPCLIALYRDVETDAPAGIHRIALTPETMSGGKVERRMLGCWPTPRAIKLWPAATNIIIGEGIETVLAAATCISHRGAPLRPAWATGSSGGIARFPVVPGVERLTILVDNDANGVGHDSAKTCAERWIVAGCTVVLLTPRRIAADFNDLVPSMRHEAHAQ